MPAPWKARSSRPKRTTQASTIAATCAPSVEVRRARLQPLGALDVDHVAVGCEHARAGLEQPPDDRAADAAGGAVDDHIAAVVRAHRRAILDLFAIDGPFRARLR